ncbi:hypothetical protein Bbelb_040720 [Branchiostoma belcheri]|nr:hypothetical protein Bbelb_040720 [Branchiostoma belcheri]
MKNERPVGSKRIKELAYTSLVRPTLEFACAVWDPHTEKDTSKLEAVQRREARWTTGRHRQTSSVDAMLQDLEWPTLRDRRRRARLIAFYKFHTGSLVINTKHRPMLAKNTKSTRQTHSATYRVPTCRTQYRHQSFFPRTIRDWNSLPAEVVLSPTLDTFRSKILTLPLPSYGTD